MVELLSGRFADDTSPLYITWRLARPDRSTSLVLSTPQYVLQRLTLFLLLVLLGLSHQLLLLLLLLKEEVLALGRLLLDLCLKLLQPLPAHFFR